MLFTTPTLKKVIIIIYYYYFLGFELSKGGIKPQARLTEAINNYKHPETRKELKGFLGLARFYRASDDGGPGGPWPLHFFAKNAIPKSVDHRSNSF